MIILTNTRRLEKGENLRKEIIRYGACLVDFPSMYYYETTPRFSLVACPTFYSEFTQCQTSSCISNDESTVRDVEATTGEAEEIGTFLFVEFATFQETLDDFDTASTTDLIEAYNELVQFCNDPYEIVLDEVVILQSQVTTVAETADGGGRRKRRLRQGQQPQQQNRKLQAKSRASGFLQGFGACGRTCPSNQRLFDDVSSRRLQAEEANAANTNEERKQRQQRLRASKRSLNEGTSLYHFTDDSEDIYLDICRGNYPTTEEMIAYFTDFLATNRTNYQNIAGVTDIEEFDEAPELPQEVKCSKSGKKKGKKTKKSHGCQDGDDQSGGDA